MINHKKRVRPCNKEVQSLHQNSQIATNKIEELDMLCKELQPDILVVSEHGFNDQSVNLFSIENYFLGNYFCRKTFKGGGVAIFAQNCLNIQPIELKFSVDKDFEVAGIKFHSGQQPESVLVFGIYRSPDGNLETFFEKMESLLNYATHQNSNFIIIGDFNINALHMTAVRLNYSATFCGPSILVGP